MKATGVDQFSKAFGNAGKNVQGLEKSSKGASIGVGTLLKTIAGVAATVGVFRTLTNSLDGAISRFDTLNSFPRVLQLMGFDAAQSEKAISDLSDGIDGLPTTLDSVASTTQRIATMTGDLDGAVETTLALNNAFLASGSSSADASRGLEQYVQMLSKGEVDLQSWRSLQETMPVALNKTAEAFGFTGRSAQNDLYDALKEGEITFDEFNGKLIELSEATGGFADMARESSTGIRTSWQNVQTAVVKGLADMLASIDNALSGFGGIAGVFDNVKVGIQQMFGFINSNIPTVLSAIQSIYEALKPWLPLIMSIVTAFLTFNTVISIVTGVKTAVASLRVAFAALNATMLANPVALVIAVLAGLAVMLVYLWNTSDTFRERVTAAFQALLDFVMPVVQTVVDFVMQVWGMLVEWWNANSQQILTTAQNIWNSVVDVVMTVVQAVVDFVMEIWSGLVSFWQDHGQMILDAAQNVWTVIQTVITTVAKVIWNVIQTMADIVAGIWNFLWPFVEALVVSVWNNIKGVIQGAIDIITGIIQAFSALFTGNWSALWDAIKQIVSGAVQLVWNLVQLWFVGKILKLGRTLFTGLRSIISNLWNVIKSLFTSGVNVARNVVSTGFNFIRNIISSVMNAVRSVISSIWNSIRSTISSVVNSIRNTIRTIFNSLRSIVSNAFNNVKNAVKSGITGALNIIKNMFNSFKNAGRNIVTSIADGIRGAIGKVTDAISNVTQKVRSYLPFSPAKEGALRDIMDVQIAESIAQSIDRGARTAIRSMANLTDQIYREMPTANIASEIDSLHNRSKQQLDYNLAHELNIGKQPIVINVEGDSEWIKAYVNEQNATDMRIGGFVRGY